MSSSEFALRVMSAFLDAADRGELSLEDTVKAWAFRKAADDLAASEWLE